VLTAVTFWSTLRTEPNDSKVFRLLERHEPGVILHGLYLGTRDKLGGRVPFGAHPDARFLDKVGEVVDLRPLGIEGLLPRYVPNALPNRRHRNLHVGRADCAGSESLMDSLDETFTSWMRDLRVGQARIVVPSDYLRRAGRGQGAMFDVDQEVFTPLDMAPEAAANSGITPVEFTLRTREHAETAEALSKVIVGMAGYSVQTFGFQGEGSDQTATEVNAREKKSKKTRARKGRYWSRPVEETLENLLIIDRAMFNRATVPFRPRLDLAPFSEDNPREVAETVQILRNAQAASIRTRVKMAQPELEGDELEKEVQAIMDEEAIGVPVPDPTGFGQEQGQDEDGDAAAG
jgi:A118 family predicted phage portal protein